MVFEIGNRVILPAFDGLPLEKGVVVDAGGFEVNASTLIVIVDPVYRIPAIENLLNVGLGPGSREICIDSNSGAYPASRSATSPPMAVLDPAPSLDPAADAAAVAAYAA